MKLVSIDYLPGYEITECLGIVKGIRHFDQRGGGLDHRDRALQGGAPDGHPGGARQRLCGRYTSIGTENLRIFRAWAGSADC